MLKDYLPLIRFVGILLCPVFYIVSFASTAWITADNRVWGLWTWCYTNFTDQDKAEDYVDDTQRCHTIHPGESPGYFEAVRVLACFTLLVFILFYFTCKESEGLGREKKPAVIAFLAGGMSCSNLAILGKLYEDDKRWRDSDYALEWAYWLCVASSILAFIMVFVHYKQSELRKKPSTSSARVTPRQPASRPSESSDGGRACPDTARRNSAPSMPSATPASGRFNKSSTRTGAAAARNSNNTTTTSTSTGSFPILNPPPYEVLREPGDLPTSPPPSYESVIGNDSAYGPAPPAYLP